jgi:hypothetical protein
MAEDQRKEFGRRGPPVVLHRPKPPGSEPPAARKRSLAVSLAVMGALSLAAYETVDWIDRKLNCEPDPCNPEELICKRRSGTTYRRYRSSGWRWLSHSSGSSSSHGFFFGGFGHSGGYHFGGS